MTTQTPLTERIIIRLPGSRWRWIFLWCAIAPVAGILTLTGPRWSALIDSVEMSVSLALANAITLWGIRWLSEERQAATPALAQLVQSDGAAAVEAAFRHSGAIAPPFMLALLGAGIFLGPTYIRAPHPLMPLDISLAFAVVLPLVTFVWEYGSLLFGIYGITKMPLQLKDHQVDAMLGLHPIGSLATSAFYVFAMGCVILILGLTGRHIQVLVTGGIFLLGMGLFFLSVSRLHKIQVHEKAARVGETRRQVAEAIEASRGSTDPALLPVHAARLSIAETLERRAANIPEWPFPPAFIGRVTAITTSIITMILGNFILKALLRR